MTDPSPRNRLAHESSPYLRQHADNPVDWMPWGPEALLRAKQEDRPILLSIGYSACHWCHVMAHESFEDPATAALMNERYVNIKVDREEMPDVDQIYQQALQLMGENGGWPLTMFLLPDGAPFFGGTYFPPKEAFGRPSFQRLLRTLADAYRDRRDEVGDNADQFRDGLKHAAGYGREPSATAALVPDSTERAATRLAQKLDRRLGGFAGAPKFPNPKSLELVLRGARRFGLHPEPSDEAKDLVLAVGVTLLRMAEGGIYDQLSGGFARYSTDERWLVPHFEKMLYDNGQLLSLYAEALQITGEPIFAGVLRETAAYLERDLRDPSGGLYTAEDADSEGIEGKFYVWTPAEIREVLGNGPEAALVERCLGVVEGGNWQDPHGHGPVGASILHVVERPTSDEEPILRRAKEALLAHREKRVRPGLDDKILASSNGLALQGLSEAGRILGDRKLLDGAVRTAEFLLGHMLDEKGRLFRTWKAGQGRLPGTLDDHALVADGLISLYEATGTARWLDEAYRLTALAVELFYNDAEAAFYVTAAGDGVLIERPVSSHDHAVPSGMSVCLENLIRLGDVYGERRWQEIAERVLVAHAKQALASPFGWSNLLNALDLHLEGPAEIVLTGSDTSALETALAGVYVPNRVLVRAAGAPARLSSLTAGKDGTAAWVCRNFACERPETDPARLQALLARPR